jgi:hypothetical protein
MFHPISRDADKGAALSGQFKKWQERKSFVSKMSDFLANLNKISLRYFSICFVDGNPEQSL